MPVQSGLYLTSVPVQGGLYLTSVPVQVGLYLTSVPVQSGLYRFTFTPKAFLAEKVKALDLPVSSALKSFT